MFEVGDWVRCVDTDDVSNGHLESGMLYKVLGVYDKSITVCRYGITTWRKDHFALVRNHNAPLRVGDRVKVLDGYDSEYRSLKLHDIGTIGHVIFVNIRAGEWRVTSGDNSWWYNLDQLELVEPVEVRDVKDSDMAMMYDRPVYDCRDKESRLRYELIEPFGLKELEMVGACAHALLKVVKDFGNLGFKIDRWDNEYEKYFDQDFNGENGLEWLRDNGFIRKVSEWPKPLGDCKGYDGYLKVIASGSIVRWNPSVGKFVYAKEPHSCFGEYLYFAKATPVNVKITVEEV